MQVPLHALFAFVTTLLCETGVCSCLTKLNSKRKQEHEPPIDENHAAVYEMQNKSSWRIDGKSFMVICNFSAMIMHMKALLCDKLTVWKLCNPDTAGTVPDVSVLGSFLSDWASTLTAQYSIADIKNEYMQCVSCLVESEGSEVDLALVPTTLGEFLKSDFSSFYREFVVFEEGSENGTLSEGEFVDEKNVQDAAVEGESNTQLGAEFVQEGEDGVVAMQTDNLPPEQDPPQFSIGDVAGDLSFQYCAEVVDLPDLPSPSSKSDVVCSLNSSPKQYKVDRIGSAIGNSSRR